MKVTVDQEKCEAHGRCYNFAPELFEGDTYTFGSETDLWALGITFYYLLTGCQLFDDAKSIFDLKDKIVGCDIDFELIADLQARHCVKRMLDKNPKTRATIDYLLKTDWV